MPEHPYARYTREKTWQALYGQAINACYALVPNSATNNSIWLLRCKSPEETQETMARLLALTSEIEAFFACKPLYNRNEDNDWPLYTQWLKQKPASLKSAGEAVVLARSSDFWRYHLEDQPGLALVVVGQHDSYLHLPCWETSSNQRYAPRETALTLGSPQFDQARGRGRQLAHTILVSALAAGDQVALAYVKEKSRIPERTQRRLRQEADALQSEQYRGRPLAFHTDAQRQVIGAKISAGLIRYHQRRRTG